MICRHRLFESPPGPSQPPPLARQLYAGSLGCALPASGGVQLRPNMQTNLDGHETPSLLGPHHPHNSTYCAGLNLMSQYSRRRAAYAMLPMLCSHAPIGDPPTHLQLFIVQRWARGVVELMPITHLNIKSNKAPQQRALLAVASQSSGVVPYTPTGYTIHSEDFSRFFAQTHANRAVTGKRCLPCKAHVHSTWYGILLSQVDHDSRHKHLARDILGDS